MAKKLIFESKEHGIRLEQAGGRRKLFTVTYGKQISENLSYTRAAIEFGLVLFHALACEGKLDNSGE